MHRFTAGALAPVIFSLLATAAPVPAVAEGFGARPLAIPARTACDAHGRCYETGDQDYQNDDAPPPRRRYDPDDNEWPVPPIRRRYDPDNDDRPPPRRRYDPDDDDRPPSPPHRRYDPDDDDRPPLQPHRRYDPDNDN